MHAVTALAALLSQGVVAVAQKPHLIFVMVDDYGWNNVGFHAKNNPNSDEVVTPNMDALAASGIELDRHYAFRFCSPSRSSFNTGRNPIHVNVGNDPLSLFNTSDPVSGQAGIPRNMTGLASKLAEAGYSTVQAGKWHIGLATPDHIPMGRGYQQSLTYLDGANDYFTSVSTEFCNTAPYTDLWNHAGPWYNHNNSWNCSQQWQPPSCIYEDDAFTAFTLDAISAHDPSTPLFLYFAPHNVHQPLEVPAAQLEKFDFVYGNCSSSGVEPRVSKAHNCAAMMAAVEAGSAPPPENIECCYRQYYAAMANYVDGHIGKVVAALQARGMWNNTLLVLSADNGGPIYRNGSAGANNYPLRGGKKSNWEGGVRVNALVAGGFLPASQAGTKLEAFIAMEDWYRTFCGLAGVDPFDARAAAAGLPPVEGFDQWPLLSGANSTPPRTEVWLGSAGPGDADGSYPAIVQGLIRADGFKILYGNVIENTWTGPFYPNKTTGWCDTCPMHCGPPNAPTCLFNVLNDPTEHVNLASSNPSVLASMTARLAELQATVFSPMRGSPDERACYAGNVTWNGFVGYFAP